MIKFFLYTPDSKSNNSNDFLCVCEIIVHKITSEPPSALNVMTPSVAVGQACILFARDEGGMDQRGEAVL